MEIKYLITGLLLAAQTAAAQLPAFPGAEGFGAAATGGRGGKVYHVTNLNDSGDGSFRDAVSVPGRTVVFDTCGVIRITDKIKAAGGLTIAGQTAPGDGIVVYGNSISFSGNTIVRYMRFRGSINMPKGACVLVADSLEHIIFDHVSVQWGRWDNLHLKDSKNATYQYCLIGESIDPQRFGALFENPENVTVHHCLWIDNQSRNPKAKAGIAYINNIVYNWGVNGLVGGHSGADHYQDVIANYFIAGPQSSDKFIGMFSVTDHVYHTGNIADLNKNGLLDGRIVADTDFISATATLLTAPTHHAAIPVKVQSAAEAYSTVSRECGASLYRDAVDARLIGYLTSLGREGVIYKTEEAAGGQQVLHAGASLPDKDRDGIPDTWEVKMNLNPDDSSDAGEVTKDGYTNLEHYINVWLLHQ